MSISLKVDNSQLNKAANLFARFIPSLEGTEKDVEGILGTANKLQFESLGRRGNTPWDQLKPATLKEKERLGFGNEQVLVRTGKFEQVIINPQVRTESGGMQQVASFQVNMLSLLTTSKIAFLYLFISNQILMNWGRL